MLIINEYLEFIKNTTELTYDMYCLLLDEIYYFYKSHNITRISNQNINEKILMKFYVNNTFLYDKIKENNMKDLVHWLFT